MSSRTTMRLSSEDITMLIRACLVYKDQTSSEYIWDRYDDLIKKLEYYEEENCVSD